MLHMTKVAYGCQSLAELMERITNRIATTGEMFMTTRYIPKRQSEMAGAGSLFWIIKHQLVARAPILEFRSNAEGRYDIMLSPDIVPVVPIPRRAHQGWRYLEAVDAPNDLADGILSGDTLPPEMLGDLAELSLI
jgi:hypothetical protein